MRGLFKQGGLLQNVTTWTVTGLLLTVRLLKTMICVCTGSPVLSIADS